MDDYTAIHALETDPDVMHFIGNGSLSTPEKNVSQITKRHRTLHETSFLVSAPFMKRNLENLLAKPVLIYLEYNDAQPKIEISYRLRKDFWDKGFATELTKSLIDWGFKNLTVDNLIAVVDPRNLKITSCRKKIRLSVY